MGFWKRDKTPAATAVQSAPRAVRPWEQALPPGPAQRALYRSLRRSVPIIDAAVSKLRRLIGEFTVMCADPAGQEALDRFLGSVQVGAAGRGAQEFIGSFLEELLTCGTAVGEMVVAGGRLRALYNADLDDLELTSPGPLEVAVAVREGGRLRPCPYPELLLVSALNPRAGQPWD